MAIPSVHQGNQHFAGNVTFSGQVNLPAASVGDSEVEAGAGIDATKLVHQFPLVFYQVTGSAAASQAGQIHIANAAGNIVSAKLMIDTAAAGAATVTVDLQKSTGGAAFATVLSSVITVNSSTAVRTAVAGTVASAAYVAGDILRLVVTATAGGGTLPQGLCVVVFVRENPQ